MKSYRLYIMILASLGIHLGVLGIWSQLSPPIQVTTDLPGQSFNVALQPPTVQTQVINQVSKQKKLNKPKPEQSTTNSKVKIPKSQDKNNNNSLAQNSSPAQKPQQQPALTEQQANLSQQKFTLLNNDMLKELHSEFRARFKYPMLARKRGWQGKVVLALNINLHGKIANIAVKHSSGYKVLDHNAVKTFEAIGMVSPRLHGRIKQTRSFNIPIVYQLNGG